MTFVTVTRDSGHNSNLEQASSKILGKNEWPQFYGVTRTFQSEIYRKRFTGRR